MEALKKKFRDGHHAEAIAECEALRRVDPGNQELKRLCAMMNAVGRNYGRALELLLELRDAEKEDADILFNIGICERELRNLANAEEYFKIYTNTFPSHPHGWAGLAECQFESRSFAAGIKSADRAIGLDASCVPAWKTRGDCQRATGRFEDALASYRRAIQIHPTVECWLNAGLTSRQIGKPAEALDCLKHAIELAPDLARLRVVRGDILCSLERVEEGVDDYKKALLLDPADDETLRKACLCLLQSNQGVQAVELCRDIKERQPGALAPKHSAEWLLSQLVPSWHVPMINEEERNNAYYDGLRSVVTPDKVIFEIGTGSGLLAMMAAKLGARKIFACESVDLIAEAANRIVKRNGFQDQITVLAKPSHSVELGTDLPVKADVLVHEIFSSDLLAEDVLPAIEDAKERLLKPAGQVVPAAASIMIALVGGDDLGRNLYVKESFGFDLSDFNAITPRRRWLHREDLTTVLLSDPVEAFRFDFQNASIFPAEAKVLKTRAVKEGLCFGMIQWIRVELNEKVAFENHPSQCRPIANWQRTMFALPEPIYLKAGSTVSISAAHDRNRPWFDLASHEPPSEAGLSSS